MNSSWLYNRNRIMRQQSEEMLQLQQQIANSEQVSTDLPIEQTMLLLLNDDTVTTLSIGTGLTGPA